MGFNVGGRRPGKVPTSAPRLENAQLPDSQYKNTDIEAAIERLRLERLSNRDIVEQLVEMGFRREMAVDAVRDLLKQRELPADVTSPLLLALGTLVVMVWGFTPTAETDPRWVGPLKIILVIVGIMIAVPSAGAVLYKVYDRIPGLDTFVEWIMMRRQRGRIEVMELDRMFKTDALSDAEYQAQLVAIMGPERGKRHYRLMRNHKHFGLE